MRDPSASEESAGKETPAQKEAPTEKEARSFQPFLHSHKMLTSVLKSSLDGIMAFSAVRDDDGRIVDFEWRMANPVAAEAVGQEEEALVGQRLLTAFPDLRDTDLFDAAVRVVETGEPLRRELHRERRKREGEKFRGWFRVSAVRLGDGLSVTFHDVTERKEAVEALRESEERFRMMAENISDLVCLHEPDGTCTFASPSARRILGYAPDELLGCHPAELTHPDDQARVRTTIERTREGEHGVIERVRLRHRSGSYLHAEAVCRPIRNDDGRVTRLLTSTRDVSERVQAEKDLERTNTELRLRNRELQDFAHIASHDLQEPLRKVRAFAGLMREDYAEEVDETGRYYLERMQDGAERMARLVSDLLSLSRVTTQGDPFEPVDLSEIAAVVRTDLELRIAETGGRVEIGDLPRLEADHTQMRQLLQNLIGNALKFHREGVPPVVQVRGARKAASEHDGGNLPPGTSEVCRLVVEDNGIGLEKKFMDRIFTPLQRLHGHSEYDGTGIGLAVCRRIAERHNGTIHVESTPGEGSCFTVLLPARQPQEETFAGQEPANKAPAGRPNPAQAEYTS